MESLPNQDSKGSVLDGLLGDDVAEGWSFEDSHYKAGLDVGYSQPVSVFESENGSAQSSFNTDFTSSQWSSHNAFGQAGNNHLDLAWVQQEATEAHNWLPTFDANAVYTNFSQEINNRDMITKSPRAALFVPVTFQELGTERVDRQAYALQQGFEPLPDGESVENPRYNNSLYVLTNTIPISHHSHITPFPYHTNSKTHKISGTAVNCPHSNPIAPPPRNRNRSLSQNFECRNSIATFAPVTTKKPSREKPISNAT
jgi:hypothetical protein